MLGQRRGNLGRGAAQVRKVLLDFRAVRRRQRSDALLESLVELGARVRVAGAEPIGPEAEACRARALPLITQDETRVPDHVYSGPDLPADEVVRRRFFGEE